MFLEFIVLFSRWNAVVQTLVAVIDIRSDRITLLLPEAIGRIVVLEDEVEDLCDAFGLERFFNSDDQIRCDSLMPEIGMDAEVMDDAPAAIVTGKGDADHSVLIESGKAGVRVALQVSGEAFPAVINGIHGSDSLFGGIPQRKDRIIVVS